jgi:hypothetical protein
MAQSAIYEMEKEKKEKKSKTVVSEQIEKQGHWLSNQVNFK